MIARLSGLLAEVDDGSILVERDGLGYEVLVPSCAVSELASRRGQSIVLYTLEYLEGNAAGGNMIPRLIGFCREEDRAFFTRFITVKGMGMRKALRALTEPVSTIAAAIEEGDAAMLKRLPGIGQRAAEHLIAELRGKLEAFAVRSTAHASEPDWTQAQRDALSILVSLGDRQADAQRWLHRATELHPNIQTADEWVKAVYRIKSGAEG